MRLTRIKAVFAGLVVAAGAVGQINLLSDVITFRTTSDKTKTTTHYGKIVNHGKSTALKSTSDAGGTGGINVGIMGIAGNQSGSGARNIGVWGSTTGTTGELWAGFFSGNVFATGTYQSSDEKLKKDVAPLQGVIQQIMQLQPKTYYFDAVAHPTMNLSSKKQFGLIAQDLEGVFPDMVMDVTEPDTSSNPTKAPNTFKAVNYTQLIAVLIAGMQEQQKEIAALRARLGME